MKFISRALQLEIQQLPIFHEVATNDLQRLLAGSKILVHHHHENLFTYGGKSDFFGYILDGAYKLSLHNSSGEEVIFHFGTKGEALAIMSVMEKSAFFPFDAISLGTSRFLQIPKNTFLTEWIRTPSVMLRFQTDLQGRIFRSYEEKRQQRMELAQRVASLLLYLTEYKSFEQNRISFPLTRKDIANYAGTTVESVIRLLSDWTHKKIIQSHQRNIEILNRPKLEELLEQDSDHNQDACHMLEDLWSKTAINSFKTFNKNMN